MVLGVVVVGEVGAGVLVFGGPQIGERGGERGAVGGWAAVLRAATFGAACNRGRAVPGCCGRWLLPVTRALHLATTTHTAPFPSPSLHTTTVSFFHSLSLRNSLASKFQSLAVFRECQCRIGLNPESQIVTTSCGIWILRAYRPVCRSVYSEGYIDGGFYTVPRISDLEL